MKWDTREPTVGDTDDDDLQPTVEDSDKEEPSPAQQRELLRIHRALGHPRNVELARALRHAGAKPNIIRWARLSLQCPVCLSRPRPLARRPSMLPRCLSFNKVSGIDLLELSVLNISAQPVTCLNAVCWGTGLQVVVKLPAGKTSREVRDAFARHWITPFGWPDLVISDQGPEFVGHEFNEFLGEHGVLDHKTDSQSPWQNGRAERAGAEVKDMV